MASEATTTEKMNTNSGNDNPNPYLIAGIVAAAVAAAATSAYIIWRRSYANKASADSVQELLDKAHQTLHLLEDRLGELHSGNISRGNDTPATA